MRNKDVLVNRDRGLLPAYYPRLTDPPLTDIFVFVHMSVAIPIYVLQGLLQEQEASDVITRSEGCPESTRTQYKELL